jgi:hypothetical protein
MVLIFLYIDIHTIVHNFYNIVNIDTLGMHFQNFVLIFVLPWYFKVEKTLIPKLIWYVKNPIAIQCQW